MKALLASLFALFLFTTPTHAMECANAAGATAPSAYPDDAGNGNSIACGSAAVSNGHQSTAIGFGAVSGGAFSAALGVSSSAAGTGSIALGSGTFAIGLNTSAIGSHAYAESDNTMVFGAIPGINNGFYYANAGFGTFQPSAPLHVARNNGTAQIYVQETNATGASRTLFKLSNKGNTKFEIEETGTGNSWAFTNSGSDFRLSKQGSGVVELMITNSGSATLAGALTQNSDVNAKQAIVPVDTAHILDKVTALPISQWQYKDETGVNHVGPMAQDFHAAFGLGANDKGISSIDTGGVALAAIQALEARNRELEARVTQLEGVLTQLLPSVAINQ